MKPLKGKYTRYKSGDVRKEIARIFFRPILEFCPDSVDRASWIDWLMGVGKRFIILYKVTETFRVPGAIKPTPYYYLHGTFEYIRKDRKVLVRNDVRFPNVIEIEADIGKPMNSRLFQVTEDDFNSKIRPILVPFNEKSKEEIKAWENAKLENQRFRRGNIRRSLSRRTLLA